MTAKQNLQRSVLVVEDEVMIRTMLTDMLDELGFDIGAESVHACRKLHRLIAQNIPISRRVGSEASAPLELITDEVADSTAECLSA